MAVEGSHVQLTEITRETIPMLNWMMDDLFCHYGVSIPYFMLDFSFSDYPDRSDYVTYTPPDWYLPEWKAQWPTFVTQWPTFADFSGFNFNIQLREWDYWLPWFNELLGLLFDEADLPRWQMPDLSPNSVVLLNEQINNLYFHTVGEEKFSPVWTDGELLLASMHRARSGVTYAATKAAYQVMEDAGTANLIGFGSAPSGDDRDGAIWGAYTFDTSYAIWTYQVCLHFDTTNASVGHATATLYLPVDDLIVTGGNPTLYLYKTARYVSPTEYNWTEGTKIGEHEFDGTEEGTTVRIDMGQIGGANEPVNIGGYSHYRLAIKDMVDVTYISEPLGAGRANMTQQSVMPTFDDIELVLT